MGLVVGVSRGGGGIAGSGFAAADWPGRGSIVARAVGGSRRYSRREKAFIWLGTAGLVLAAAGFACWIAVAMGRQTALEFVTGYTIEASLSVDNLFVFLVLFEGFQIGRKRQHKRCNGASGVRLCCGRCLLLPG